MTTSPVDYINDMPACEFLGLEIIGASDGHATGRLPFREELCFDAGHASILHGAASFALVDNVGAAAVMSYFDEPRPAYTIDMRIDYLSGATTTLTAEADVRRFGNTVAITDMCAKDANGETVVMARGTFRSG